MSKDMTATITESELFDQFTTEGSIVDHARSGKVLNSTPVANFLGSDSEVLTEFLERATEGVEVDWGSGVCDALDMRIDELRQAAEQLEFVRDGFAKVMTEQFVGEEGLETWQVTSPTNRKYRPIRDGVNFLESGGTPTGDPEFVDTTPDDAEHIRRG